MHADCPLGVASCMSPPVVLPPLSAGLNFSHLDNSQGPSMSQKVPTLVGLISPRQGELLQKTPETHTYNRSCSAGGPTSTPRKCRSLVSTGLRLPNQLAGVKCNSPGPQALTFIPAGSSRACPVQQHCRKGTGQLRGGTQFWRVMEESFHLGRWAEKNTLSLWAEHIAGTSKTQAAYLSRSQVDNAE